VVHSFPSPFGLAFLAAVGVVVVVVLYLAAMASEIEIVTEGLLEHQHQHQQKENGLLLQTKQDEEDRKKEDIYTAAAYGDMEKLLRLVQRPGGVFSITQPDAGGYFALHWSALNNRFSVAEYLLQVVLVLSYLCRVLLTSCCKQLSRRRW
jgi:hypothetical protein